MTTTTTEGLAELAREAHGWFETRERVRPDGSTEEYVTLKDERPEWVHELVRTAHGTDHDGSPAFLPDDYRYKWVRDALEVIGEQDDFDPDELRDEFADADTAYPYTSDRIAWLGSNLQRIGYCDEAAADGIAAALGLGIAAEREEVFSLVLRALEGRAEEVGSDG